MSIYHGFDDLIEVFDRLLLIPVNFYLNILSEILTSVRFNILLQIFLFISWQCRYYLNVSIFGSIVR